MLDLHNILDTAQLLALIVITGGTIVMGALVAPTLFKCLNREEAGSVMVSSFSKFDEWIKISSLTLLLAKLTELALFHNFQFMVETKVGEEVSKSLNTDLAVSSILVAAIVATSLHIAIKLSPQIIKAYDEDSPEFARLHQQSELLHRLNFILGLILLVFYSCN